MRGRKLDLLELIHFSKFFIEKEKSPWGDENSSVQSSSSYCGSYRKREIPVRGRKPIFFPIDSSTAVSIEKEKSPWGDENCLEILSALYFRFIEKEKSPWGDENSSVFLTNVFTSPNRKREIPVRGRKPESRKRCNNHCHNRKREIPVRGRKPSCSIVFTAVSIIEKEKSPWGDENKNLNKSIICSFIL